MSDLVAPGLSHVLGSTATPLLEETIYGAFAQQALRQQQRTALIAPAGKVRYSYAELFSRVDRLANGLAELGLGAGDRLGIWCQNCSEWLETQLAAPKLAAILVNVNPDYRPLELEHALNLVECKVLVTAPASAHIDFAGTLLQLCPELAEQARPLSCRRCPALRHVVSTQRPLPGMVFFDSLYMPGERLEAASSCDEPVNIQFTSGTTGKPKASTLTHRGILNNGLAVGRTMAYTNEDVVCVPVPLYHCFGCVQANMAMVAIGCTLVYPAPKFDPLLTLRAVSDYSCTSLYGVPTMYIAMLEHPEFPLLRPKVLRTGIMAGALCPIELMSRVIHEMGATDITNCYGMTETSPVSWQTRIGTPLDLRCTTVGQIHPHAECKVVDPSTHEVLPCGTAGELWTAGYLVMQGYWEDQAATASAIIETDGRRWMRTGDLAVITADGFCQIVGRIKDMILRGGENIFPKEVEDPLLGHPNVVNASVIGVPDERLGEQVCAWIILRAGVPKSGQARDAEERSIREYLKERVAHFKIPKYIVFKEEFPLTVTMKIRKVEMREISTRELGLVPKATLSRL